MGLVDEAITYLSIFPELLQSLLKQHNNKWYETYRKDGWNTIQLIHHLADSHTNAYRRFKLTLTEDTPTVKPYNEKQWAFLPDVSLDNLEDTITLIKSIHIKWTNLAKQLKQADWNRKYYHPESQKFVTLKELMLIYQWHAKHHLKHIQMALNI